MADNMPINLADQVWAALEDCFRNSGFKTYKALAEAAGVGISTVSDIKKRKLVGSRNTHEKLAAAFGLNINAFYEIGRKLLEDQPDQKQAPQQGEVIDINGVGQALKLDQHVADDPLGPALQAALAKLKAIYTSGDDVIIRAITENLNAFEKAVDYRQELKETKQELYDHNSRIRHLEGIIEGLMGGNEQRKKRRS
jgi:hypothetical protein